MKLEDFIQYLIDNDCHLDEELETDEFYVVVNLINQSVATVPKDPIISGNTAVIVFKSLNVRCHYEMEDHYEVFNTFEQSRTSTRYDPPSIIDPNRLN